MSEKKNAFEQVMAARFLTQSFAALHGLQVDQLIIWGYLIFQHTKFGELQVAADMKNKVVQYELTTKKKMPNRVKGLIETLKSNIQMLLGPEWDVTVIQGGKTIFGVERNIATKVNDRRKQTAKGGGPATD